MGMAKTLESREYLRGLRDGMELERERWREWLIERLRSTRGALAKAQLEALEGEDAGA